MIHVGNVLNGVPRGPVPYRCAITSPPYWQQRDYGHADQIGQEPTAAEYVANLVLAMRHVRDVLADDGTLWLNLGDTVRNRKICGVPWRAAFALQDDGWHLVSEVIWHKTRVMPEAACDRFVRNHETLFVLAKSDRHYFDLDAVREPNEWESKDKRADGRRHPYAAGSKYEGTAVQYNPKGKKKRTVWSITPSQGKSKHYAPFPEALVEPCVEAGSAVGDWVLDPFSGTGTTCRVAARLGRHAIGLELNEDYVDEQS